VVSAEQGAAGAAEGQAWPRTSRAALGEPDGGRGETLSRPFHCAVNQLALQLHDEQHQPAERRSGVAGVATRP
jgi:hypothetical protein